MTYNDKYYIWECIWDAQKVAREELAKYYNVNGTETTTYSDSQKEALEWRIKNLEGSIKAEVVFLKLVKGQCTS